MVRPDVTVAEDPNGAPGGAVTVVTPPATVAKLFLVRVDAPEVDRRVEIVDYMVCVFCATQPEERAFYPLRLRQPLRRFAIPLRPGDRDVALDLQAVVDQAYADGRYDRTDYRLPLHPPLPPEDAKWAAEVLRNAGKIPSEKTDAGLLTPD